MKKIEDLLEGIKDKEKEMEVLEAETEKLNKMKEERLKKQKEEQERKRMEKIRRLEELEEFERDYTVSNKKLVNNLNYKLIHPDYFSGMEDILKKLKFKI